MTSRPPSPPAAAGEPPGEFERRLGRRRLLASLPLAALPAAVPVLSLPANASTPSGGPPATAGAVPRELLLEWGVAHLHGQGRLRFLGLHVYDIRLWTPQPGLVPDDWSRRQLALEIEYARGFSARTLAERSIDEMRRATPVPADVTERWLRTLVPLMPDIKTGDRLTGVQRPEGVARFFHNGNLRGEARDVDFTRRFFGIWLGDASSEPALREALLGRR